MRTILDLAPVAGHGRILLVMLPGTRDVPEDFVRRGFVEAIRNRGLPVDVVAADAHMEYYAEHSVIDRLAADVIAPARKQGYAQIWLMGISLGGFGSMAYVCERATEIDGVILLAPYLGSRGLIGEVGHAGGLNNWQPGKIPRDDEERRVIAWLREYRAKNPSLPAIYLGYGSEDRFIEAAEMLAQRLPAERVVMVQGGHDWPTWTRLWVRMLDLEPFSSGGRLARPGAARETQSAN
jgi:pimeloyl-ACP methyl ester carboxylesterase